MKWIVVIILSFCAFSVDVNAQLPKQYNGVESFSVLNSPSDDYAPSYNTKTGKIYFTSERAGKADFYSIPIVVAGHAPIKVKTDVGKSRDNISYLVFSAANRALFCKFTLFERRPFLSVYEVAGDSIEKPKPKLRPVAVSEDFNGHPAVNSFATEVIFSSNRNHGFGALDLWIVRRLPDNSWSEPENIGGILNTSGNEISPYFFSDDILVFASDGFGGKGGYELFCSVKENGLWQPPIPISDLNTEYDESDFCVLPDGRSLFSSNRPGGAGGWDIFEAK